MRYEDKRFLHPQEACFGQMKRLPLSGELARRKPWLRGFVPQKSGSCGGAFFDNSEEQPMEPLKIGNIILPHRAVFGPMAGFTDAPCRRLMAQHGAGFTVSEMVSSRALVYGDHKTVSLLKAEPTVHPMACRSLAKCPRSWAKPPPPSNSTSSTLWISTWAARPPRSCPAAQAAS